jgi:hypothetical protein
VPSIEVALKLARLLRSSVEDLFWLDDDGGQVVKAELMGAPGPLPEGTRMQLVRFGSRWLTRPLKDGASISHTFTSADAVVSGGGDGTQVELKLLNRAAADIPTLVLAGCDPASSILASMLRDLGVRLIWIEAESMPSLHSLARGEIHIAGCNFMDRVTGSYNLPFVKESVPFPCTVIRFALWRQGMIVGHGNPKTIRHIDDLAKPDVTFINRHPGQAAGGC